MFTFARWLRGRSAATQRGPRPGSRTAQVSASPRAPRGPVALALHQARYDFLGFARNRQARFFTLMLPMLFLVILVTMFGNETVGPLHVREATYYVPGIAAMGVISASFVNLVMSIISERESGALKRRRATPVPASVLIAGRVLTTVAISLTVMIGLLAFGAVVFGVDLPAASLPVVVITGVVGAVTFSILGYALAGLIGSTDAAQPMVQAIILPLYFISGVFVPNANLPDWLQDVGRFFPVEHLANGLHTALDPAAAGAVAPGDIAVLGVWAIVGLVVALARFSWVPSTSPA